MSIFNQYAKQRLDQEVTYKIDGKRNYEFLFPLTITTSEFEDGVNIEFSQSTKSSKEVVACTFHEDELEDLINNLQKTKDKLRINREIKTYPVTALQNVFYSIMESYYKYNTDKIKIPKPRISVFKEDDKIVVGVVDYMNGAVLMHEEIFLEESGINLTFLVDDDYDFTTERQRSIKAIANILAEEIFLSVHNMGDGPHLQYISNAETAIDKSIGEPDYGKIITHYVRNNIKIDEDIFDYTK